MKERLTLFLLLSLCCSLILTTATTTTIYAADAAAKATWTTENAAPGTEAAADDLDAAIAKYEAGRRASSGFKSSVLKAAGDAYKNGDINRWQLARLRLAVMFRPQVAAELEQCAAAEAADCGVLAAAGIDASSPDYVAAIDWGKLLEFLQKLLPLLLELLALL